MIMRGGGGRIVRKARKIVRGECVDGCAGVGLDLGGGEAR